MTGVDAIVVGAGFAGLYALHRLRAQGLSVRVLEAAPELGGTWYYNRYPGARCDVESVDYSYSFSDELQQEWDWTEESVDATGINTTDRHFDLDMIVFATGFDALTGALANIDIVGRDAETLRDDWADGPRTYLGLSVDGFPNLFLISGPGAPAVLANMVLHAEAQVNWIAEAIAYLDDHDCAAIEATTDGVDDWVAECARRAETTLFPKANSWYLGANVPGKPRGFMLFVGGFATYNEICAEVARAGYKGFDLIKVSP
ncbi:MAG: NAD(P)-binding protein [Mycobacterium sp.]